MYYYNYYYRCLTNNVGGSLMLTDVSSMTHVHLCTHIYLTITFIWADLITITFYQPGCFYHLKISKFHRNMQVFNSCQTFKCTQHSMDGFHFAVNSLEFETDKSS